ncbi:Co-chaperone Hsc20 [Apiospora hydei]|uniref:Co-chaperone Hsc20 n=1 Tax=Apiospora hydei TaxID=1337664 RepID=A0ABR1WQR3_9PEZI
MHPQTSKNRAEAASARINEAFKTLAHPLLRAQYLLELAGRADNAGTDESAKVEDPELLMEVLEAREMIEEAESEEALEPLREENGAEREAVRLRYWVNIRESIDAWEKGKPVVLEH